MIHAVQTLAQERRRLADRQLDLTLVDLGGARGIAGGVTVELMEDTRRQLADIDAALYLLAAMGRRVAA